MVNYDIGLSASPDCIFSIISIGPLITEAETDESDDDIVRFNYRGIILYADSVTRSSLPGDSQIAVSDPQF